MATFVLVHGAFGGAWCWYRVVAELERRRHRVLAPDLPGHGRNAAPTSSVTYARYVESVLDLVSAEAEPVILVGHSMGGAVITGVGEAAPEKIAALVYLTAVIGPSGTTMLEAAPPPAQGAAAPGIDFTPDGAIQMKKEGLAAYGYADCSAEDVALARLCKTPQALEPMTAPIVWTPERCGRISRNYIGCSQDRVNGSIEHQMARASMMPGTTFVTLDSSHSPFFSMPVTLVDTLETMIPGQP